MLRVIDSFGAGALALALHTPLARGSDDLGVDRRLQIFGGAASARCEWPSVVSMGGQCTGTLIHPELVLYAAHCGAEFDEVWFGESIFEPVRRVRTRSCQAFPGGTPGEGNDFAFCSLTEPQADIPIVPVIRAEELAQGMSAREVTLVGFGLDEDHMPGFKRQGVAALGEIASQEEVFIGGYGVDSCTGDSGGPAFVQLPHAHATEPAWRLLGVASHGVGCGDGGFYALAHLAVEWVRAESKLELLACSERTTCEPDSKVLPPSNATWSNGCSAAAPPEDELPATCSAARVEPTYPPRGAWLFAALAVGCWIRRASVALK